MAIDFSSPKKNPNFIRYWDIYLADIEKRDNLKQSHLCQLAMLCDLSVQYDELNQVIEMDGLTYTSNGRNGVQIHLRPEVQQRNRAVTEIRNYSKMLGLVLYKDKTTNDGDKKNEFDDD